MGKSVELVGAAQMSELRTALRQVSTDVEDVVASELERIAQGVAADARARVPRRSGAAQASYRARGTAVTFGDGVPYVPWLEFGGRVGRKKSVARPFIRAGRYAYPAINENLKDIEAQIDDLITGMTHGYLEVE